MLTNVKLVPTDSPVRRCTETCRWDSLGTDVSMQAPGFMNAKVRKMSRDAWDYYRSNHQSRSPAYHCGEEGLARFSNNRRQLCLALALWNGCTAC